MGNHVKNILSFSVILSLLMFGAVGCVVRTYSVQKERADIDLNSGNRGFLSGKSSESASVAKTTRERKVVEVEVFPLIKSLQKEKPTPKLEPVQPSAEVSASPEMAAAPSGRREYVVQTNDTLQKISSKFYGTMHKWNKIFEANKDLIKAPNRIKPGQVLIIPEDAKLEAQPLKKEDHLK